MAKKRVTPDDNYLALPLQSVALNVSVQDDTYVITNENTIANETSFLKIAQKHHIPITKSPC